MAKSGGRIRIVAGTLAGQKITTPADIRPTTERVREAIFSALGDISGMSVLDLYCGSGAIGIEALSRGASVAVFIEADRKTAATCRTNLELTRSNEQARVVESEVVRFLAGPLPFEAPFDLIYCDPPYETARVEIPRVLAGLGEIGWLAKDGRVVVEQASAGTAATGLADDWITTSERKYGGTLVVTLKTKINYRHLD